MHAVVAMLHVISIAIAIAIMVFTRLTTGGPHARRAVPSRATERRAWEVACLPTGQAAVVQLSGVEPRRIHVDKGYRGHNHPHKFRVWITGQARRVTGSIPPRDEAMKRRAAVEPAIGPTPEHRLGRNYLKDRANAVLAAADYNFSLLLRWFSRLLRALLQMLFFPPPRLTALKSPLTQFITDDLMILHRRSTAHALRSSDWQISTFNASV
jgi:hypothetical protein